MKITYINELYHPYMIEFNNMTISQWEEAYKWCCENLGEPYDMKIHSATMDHKKWVIQFGGIRFKEEAYATWFMLRFASEYN
jgi:hypothetical protein